MGRIGREKKTVAVMIRMYCRHHHATQRGLCKQCEELLEYAHGRLDRCPYGDQKPACSKCPIHCYKPDQRERVREAMRFAGPRMLTRHPILAVQHLIDSRKEAPERKGKKQNLVGQAADGYGKYYTQLEACEKARPVPGVSGN